MVVPFVEPQLRGLPPFSFSAETLAGLLHIHTPEIAMRLQRLRYLARAFKHVPPILWHLTESCTDDLAWSQRVRTDLKWLRSQHPKHIGLIDEDASFQEWCGFVSALPDWKALVSKAASAWLRYQHRLAVGEMRRKLLHFRIEPHGIPIRSSDSAEVQRYQCDMCAEEFTTKRGLFMHASQKHGYRPLPKFYAAGSYCAGCGTEYHVRPRFIAHLRTAHHCLAQLRAVFAPLSLEELQSCDQEDAELTRQQRKVGQHVRKAVLPACKVPFAALPLVGTSDAEVMLSKHMA